MIDKALDGRCCQEKCVPAVLNSIVTGTIYDQRDRAKLVLRVSSMRHVHNSVTPS